MPANDVYSVTMTSGLTNAIVVNVFFYKAAAGATTASASLLRQAFATGVQLPMEAIVTTSTPFVKIDVKNLFDDADFEQFLYSPQPTGDRTGDTISFFVALKFKSAKPTSSQQPARKAVGYISASDVAGGQIGSDVTYRGLIDDVATAFGATLTDGSANDYVPSIVKRIPYTTPGGNPAYRLPTNSGETVSFPAVNWQWDPVLKPQVSRTVGRGG